MQTGKGTRGRERTYSISTHQLWCPALCCCNDPNYSTTTSSYNWGNGLFFNGIFSHYSSIPVLGCWPPALFMNFPVLFCFWYFLVILSFPCYLPRHIFPVPFCTHLLLNYFHGLSIKPSFDCLNLRVGSTSTHYMTNIGHWKMIFFLEKVFFSQPKQTLTTPSLFLNL